MHGHGLFEQAIFTTSQFAVGWEGSLPQSHRVGKTCVVRRRTIVLSACQGLLLYRSPCSFHASRLISPSQSCRHKETIFYPSLPYGFGHDTYCHRPRGVISRCVIHVLHRNDEGNDIRKRIIYRMERGGVKNGKKNFQRAGDQDHAKERINCRMMEEADSIKLQASGLMACVTNL